MLNEPQDNGSEETQVPAVETSPEGAQPSVETTPPPAPEIPQGSDSIPRSRFNEVIAGRNRERAEKAQLLAAMQQRQQPEQPKPANTPPKEEDFANWQDFQDARSAYVADQRYEARRAQEKQAEQQQQEQSRAQSAEQNWIQKSSEAAVKYPDFDNKVNTAPPITNAYALAVLKKADAAGDLAYHLASDHALIAKINAMHPLDAAMELGRIEEKLAGSKTPPKTSVSKAPKPISPVGSGKTPAARGFSNDMSQEDFNEQYKPLW